MCSGKEVWDLCKRIKINSLKCEKKLSIALFCNATFPIQISMKLNFSEPNFGVS
jgi:hypothetical protein